MKEVEKLFSVLKESGVYSADNGLEFADQMTPESLLGLLERNGPSMFEFGNPKYSFSSDEKGRILSTVTLSNQTGLCFGCTHKTWSYKASDKAHAVAGHIKYCADKAYSVSVQSEAKRTHDALSPASSKLSWREQKSIGYAALRRFSELFFDYKVMQLGVGELLPYRPSEDEILETLLGKGGEAFNFGQITSASLDNVDGNCKAIAMAKSTDGKLWIEFTETRGGRRAAERAVATRVADITNMARAVDFFVKEMRRAEELANKPTQWKCETDEVFQFRRLLLDYKVKKSSDGLLLSYEPTPEELCKELALLGADVFTFGELRSCVDNGGIDGKKKAMAWVTSKNRLSFSHLEVTEDRKIAEKAVLAKAEILMELARAAEAALNIQPSKKSD